MLVGGGVQNQHWPVFLRQVGFLAQAPEGSMWYACLLVSACVLLCWQQRVHIGGENAARCKVRSSESLILLDQCQMPVKGNQSSGHWHEGEPYDRNMLVLLGSYTHTVNAPHMRSHGTHLRCRRASGHFHHLLNLQHFGPKPMAVY